jgi:hypothetical protein
VSNLSLQNNDLYKEWAQNHKTIIILDAINSKGVRQAFGSLCKFSDIGLAAQNAIPVTCFHEDDDSLDGAITAAACVLPESVYGRDIPRSEAQQVMENLNYGINIGVIPNVDAEYREYLLSCMIKTYNLAPR